MPKQKTTPVVSNKDNKLASSLVSILIGILANMKNVLYVYTTTLSAYLFYEAMTKDIFFTLPVLGFLAISYFPIFYRRKND
jgi:ribosomal protein S18 acetylase RimI-like enzyme